MAALSHARLTGTGPAGLIPAMSSNTAYFDSLRSERDDVVREPVHSDSYLQPGRFVDSDHREIVDHARRVVGSETDPVRQAVRLYYAVRDEVRYDPYNTPMVEHAYRASTVLAAGHGYCINKSGLLTALLRATGIPARVGYADVRNHMTTKRLTEHMGTDIFYYHGYVDVLLEGRWVKATPAFNRELTEKFRLKPLEWDGVQDSIYHDFDLAGRRHMEYLAYRGVFADIPFDEIRAAFAAYYPRMHPAKDGSAVGGDFAAEGAAEAARSA
jgi:transglutaminase-like putative cysteine protease